jgi:type IV pilus assembly protein PilE
VTPRFTLVELMIVVAIVAVLAAIALPSLYTMQLRAKRAELPTNADGISATLAAYHAASDNYYPGCGANTCGVYGPSGTFGKMRRPWAGADTAAITQNLGWTPDGDLYGSYNLNRVNVGWGLTLNGCNCHSLVNLPATVCIFATADVDGTGTSATFSQYLADVAANISPTWCATGDAATTY